MKYPFDCISDFIFVVCKVFHSRRALLTYQTIFPKDVTFYVSSVPDTRGIEKTNWFEDDEKIRVVMGEVVKIGNYFECEIRKLV